MNSQKIIVAIDSFDQDQAISIIEKLNPNLCKIKVGSVAFNSLGRGFLNIVSQKGFKIFLDLKFHDIPNTVHDSILAFSNCSIEMLTIHISGGKKMIEQAVIAGKKINSKIIGVSVLTSLDEIDAIEIFHDNLESQAKRFFKMANQTEIDGIVCSPHELKLANAFLPKEIIKITPGIRNHPSSDDQVRTMNAAEAIRNGASYIVIGRPITTAKDISVSLQDFINFIDE